MVSRSEPRLQLPDPVHARSEGCARVASQAPLEPTFVEPRLVESAERRGQTAERADQRQLCGDHVGDETEAGLSGKLQAVLRFALHIRKRVANRQQVRYQVAARISCGSQFTGGI